LSLTWQRGVTVGLVALPLAMAFAISSGVTPQAGLYCAIVTGFVISAFGGFEDANRWTDRCIRGGGRGNYRQARPRWPIRMHHDGWGLARPAGRNRNGRRGEIFSAAGDCRVYQRNRHPDRQYANKRFFSGYGWIKFPATFSIA